MRRSDPFQAATRADASCTVGLYIPGLTALVSCHDDVHVETLGTMSIGNPAPIKRDTIFRIASITKPITAAAAMILLEECKVRLGDPIQTWLPELANRRVLRSIASELDDTVPANRAILVPDLLTLTMGFGSVMAMPGTYPVQTSIRELRIGGDGPSLPSPSPTGDEWLGRLGSLPWLAQPGERWMYPAGSETFFRAHSSTPAAGKSFTTPGDSAGPVVSGRRPTRIPRKK